MCELWLPVGRKQRIKNPTALGVGVPVSYTWNYVDHKTEGGQPSQVTFELKPMDSTVKLTLEHENLMPSDLVDDDNTFEGLNNGWPAILSNLKSLLETGKTLPAISIGK
jgi:hypothetical protein